MNNVSTDEKERVMAQMSELIGSIVKLLLDNHNRSVESCNTSIMSCYQTEDEIVKTLQKEIDKEGTTFEQKQYYIEKMAEVAERKERKDTEQRNMYFRIAAGVCDALAGIATLVGVISEKSEMNLSANILQK